MNRKIKSTILILMSSILFFSNLSYVKASTNNPQTKIQIEKSESFKEWENLSKEEKENTIEPSFSDISIKESVKRSTLNNLLGSETQSVGKKFDLRTALSNEIIVKNQKRTSSCWAFSFTSMMETTMARKYEKNFLEYSPMHLEYKTTDIFSRNLNDGGSQDLALAYSTSGYGPVYESDFPFDEVYHETEEQFMTPIENVDLNKLARARVTDATLFASIYKSISDNSITYKDSDRWFGYNRYTEEQVDAIRHLIKKHIKEDGAVSATFYADSLAGVTENGTYTSTYYNNDTKAYYYSSIFNPNHAVTIVGWDDEFSKENFAEGHRPINDGAYIVLNSWGTDFGNGGYFYVSYDDASIEQAIYGISAIEEQKSYSNSYEYDQLGVNLGMPITNDEQTRYLESAYAANVFSRETIEGKYEYLSEVGLFLKSTEGIEIYVNAENDNLNNATLVATATGSNALEAGYHIIKLASPVLLTGSKFVVEVKYINSEKNFLPLECNLYDSGLTTEQDNSYNKAKSNVGESFYSTDGQNWKDLEGLTLGEYTLKNTNACIKAFSTYSDVVQTVSVTGVTLDKQTLETTVGDSTSLIATVTPANATNKSVTWTSSDTSVATVTDSGVITALKEGTTRVTVTTVDGSYKASCEVTVKRQEPVTVSVTGITLNLRSLKMQVGEKSNLVATISPTNATNKGVTWTSSDTSVATVSDSGIITALKEGTTRITVMTVDGNYKASCELTVSKKEASDDDIYKESDDKKDTSKDEEKGKTDTDDTKLPGNLPATGEKSAFIICIICITGITIISYIKYRKNRNIG